LQVSPIIAESLPNLAHRWRIRIDKARSAVGHGFRALSAQVTRGVEIELPLGAHRLFWSGRSSDADLIDFLARALPDDGLFLDVGGNIGVYSASLWRMRGNIRGVAFEPIPSTQVLLQSTFELNGVPFDIERAAVSDRAGTLTISSYANGRNNFWIKNDDGRHPTTTVPTISLDDWCGNDPKRVPGAIKIDVEGHELAVLQGGRKMLRAHRPAMVLECHGGAWDELGVSRVELDAEIRGIGYKRLCDRDGRPVDLLTARSTFHLLAIP
jgi:FkbM family methyltransferase